jgi:3-methyladenine DNA glycosylase AlkD
VTAKAIERRLRALRDPEIADGHLRFFKCGRGQYGEGDAFLGIMVPGLRALSGEFTPLAVAEAVELLQSKWHEARLLALMILVREHERGDEATRAGIYRSYLANTKRINNWDLVDVSAHAIVGVHLRERDRAPIIVLTKSESVRDREVSGGVAGQVHGEGLVGSRGDAERAEVRRMHSLLRVLRASA